MIHEITPSKFCNAYKVMPPKPTSIALYYEENLSLVKNTSQGIEFAQFKDLEEIHQDIYDKWIYLFSVDGEGYYLISSLVLEGVANFKMESIAVFRNSIYHKEAFAGITGYQLYNWYRSNKYCNTCSNTLVKDDKERMLLCEKCGQMIYPRLNPAVIIGVTHGNRILLSQYANRYHNNYALLAGFVEVGESLEEAVIREVMEEVGLHVTNVRYYKSQPWPFTDSILMGFYCDLADGNGEVTLDKEELALARWFEREDIPVKPSRDSLTNEMIIHFKNGHLPF